MAMDGVVLFEYIKDQDDELSLQVGQVVQDVKQIDEGWCEGMLGGVRGMFPDNFVKIRPAKTTVGGGLPPAAPEPTTKDEPPLRGMDKAIKNRRAKVTFSYAAENTDELTLAPGQIVKGLSEEEDGWWRGNVGGRTGVFPCNFVEVITEEVAEVKPPRPPSPEATEPPEPDNRQSSVVQRGGTGLGLGPGFNPAALKANLKKTTKPQPPPAAEPKSQPAMAPNKQDSKPHHPPPPSHPPIKQQQPPERERAKVTFDYPADNEDELTIKVGEFVEVIKKEIPDQEGWWEVQLGDKIGLVPDNFVELIASSPAQQQQQPSGTKPKTTPTDDPPTPVKETPTLPNKPLHPPPPTANKKTAGSIYGRKRPVAPPPGGKETPPTSVTPEPHDDPDFGVPTTTPLDNSALKGRPKKTARPPSRSNLHAAEENGVEGGGSPDPPPPTSTAAGGGVGGGGGGEVKLSPWQAELKKRKVKGPPPPKPAVKRMAKPSPPAPAAAKEPEKKSPPTKQPAKPSPLPPATAKPDLKHPPLPEPSSTPAPVTTATPVTVATTPATTPPPSLASPPTTSATVQSEIASLKEALKKSQDGFSKELKELRDEMKKFKTDVRNEIDTLTDDLDRERKYRATLEVDIDRLRKKVRENN